MAEQSKTKKPLGRMGKAILALGLAAVTGISVWAAGKTFFAASGIDEQRPTVRFRCMDFKLIEDGTVQALVRLSAENMEHFAGTAFNIQFNPYFIQPSYLDATGKVQKVVVADEKHDSKHFSVDPALEKLKLIDSTMVNPFISSDEGIVAGTGTWKLNEVIPGDLTGGTPQNGSLSMYLTLNTAEIAQNYLSHKYAADGTQDIVQVMDRYGAGPGNGAFRAFQLFIDATGTVSKIDGKDTYEYDSGKGLYTGKPGSGVNLGAITFQVDVDHLTEMVTFDTDTCMTTSGKFVIGYPDGEQEDWLITDLVIPSGGRDYRLNNRKPLGDNASTDSPWGDWGDETDLTDEARVVFEFIFPEVLVKAHIAGGDELTVNAYQNFGDGTIDDLARTAQRYRPEITGTYANASEKNFVFNWGDKTAPTTTNGGGYKVYRPYVVTDGATPGYTDRNGNGWTELPAGQYDPKGGEYLLTQYFWYEEDGQTKMYPLPMELHLTVTPVNLVDANADKLYDSYRQSDANKFVRTSLTDIDLPRQAVLALSPVPGQVTLTMPITTWAPNTLDGLTTSGTPAQDQDWWDSANNVVNTGSYKLNGPTTQNIIDYVKAHYKWVTIPSTFVNKEIVAVRDVVADTTAEGPVYKASYVSTDYDGTLHLLVEKTLGGANSNFALTTQFETYTPNVDRIKSDTEFLSGITATDSYSNELNAGVKGELSYNAGPAATRSTHEEDVGRAINLGGWFYVKVSEDGGTTWSDLLPVYVPRRPNYYITAPLETYYNDGNIPGGKGFYNFDFTGLRAGLYPFYSNSHVPEHVVLPIGYTVHTTYDGVTGAEPGKLGQLEVKQWAEAQVTPAPIGSVPPWDSEAIISYGDADTYNTPPSPQPEKPADLADAAYGAYGPVDNHRLQAEATSAPSAINHGVQGDELTRIRVQAPEWETPAPTPTPTPDPSASPDPSATPAPTPTPGPTNKPQESIRLIHEDSVYTSDRNGPDDIVRDGTGEVSKVIYTLTQEGYIARQTYTLTIVNDGTEDIYGLDIDVVNGIHSPANDGFTNHFEILVPPSSYIKAGGRTTFVISYVFNLKDTDSTLAGTTYEDHILITSNGYDKDNPLKDFIARFEVNASAAYKVTVVTDPGDGSMGTAKIIKGVAAANVPTPSPAPPPAAGSSPAPISATGAANKPNTTDATDTYVAGHNYVWIYAEPTDEYKVKEVYYIDGYTVGPDVKPIKVHLYTYNWEDTTATPIEKETAYFFQMPAKDVTVVVEYYEPILSKLRLSELRGFSDAGSVPAGFGDDLTANANGEEHNIRWYDDTTHIIDQPMSPADSSRPARPDYIMVLGDYKDTTITGRPGADDLTRAQLEATLRKNTLTPDIDNVTVTFYEWEYVSATGTWQRKNDTPTAGPQTGKTWHLTASAPTSHDSEIFKTPDDPGLPNAVAREIELSVSLTQTMIDADPDCAGKAVGDVVSRSFVVVIVRASKDFDYKLGYGNSPKGMIYNDDGQWATATAKADAWTKFLNNDNAFGTNCTPTKATGLTNTYWKEAWGNIIVGGAAYNGDQDEHALFILLGQAFQDPGFITLKNTLGFDVDQSKVSRSVKVDLLNTAATVTTQWNRFYMDDPTAPAQVTLDLGMGDKGLVTSTVTTDVIDNWWQTTDTTGTTPVTTTHAVRPGVYTLVYTFPDYDNTPKTVERNVIILSPVGDVNADRGVCNGKETPATGLPSDVDYIHNRVTDPLGGMTGDNPTAATNYYIQWRLFRYRCVDSNNDRNVNDVDANVILNDKDHIVPYYKPTGYR